VQINQQVSERLLLAESRQTEAQIIADLNVRFKEKRTSGDQRKRLNLDEIAASACGLLATTSRLSAEGAKANLALATNMKRTGPNGAGPVMIP
jgi:hypothetical protein